MRKHHAERHRIERLLRLGRVPTAPATPEDAIQVQVDGRPDRASSAERVSEIEVRITQATIAPVEVGTEGLEGG
ncbi:MAG: hypothetical protein AB7R89_20310 [Dehalococcoidia bacterium]